MTDICLCDKTATREQIIRNNNLCKCCNKAYRLTIDIDSPEQTSKVSEGQAISEDNRIYENTDTYLLTSDSERVYTNCKLTDDPFL